MTKSRNVVVTGIGGISPLGNSVEALWEALINGRSGIVRIEAIDCAGLTTNIGGEVRDFDPVSFLDKKEARRMDRFAQFAVYAAEKANENGFPWRARRSFVSMFPSVSLSAYCVLTTSRPVRGCLVLVHYHRKCFF